MHAPRTVHHCAVDPGIRYSKCYSFVLRHCFLRLSSCLNHILNPTSHNNYRCTFLLRQTMRWSLVFPLHRSVVCLLHWSLVFHCTRAPFFIDLPVDLLGTGKRTPQVPKPLRAVRTCLGLDPPISPTALVILCQRWSLSFHCTGVFQTA